jgi:hypothetical protein
VIRDEKIRTEMVQTFSLNSRRTTIPGTMDSNIWLSTQPLSQSPPMLSLLCLKEVLLLIKGGVKLFIKVLKLFSRMNGKEWWPTYDTEKDASVLETVMSHTIESRWDMGSSLC